MTRRRRLTDKRIAEIMLLAFPRTKCSRAYLGFARHILAADRELLLDGLKTFIRKQGESLQLYEALEHFIRGRQ